MSRVQLPRPSQLGRAPAPADSGAPRQWPAPLGVPVGRRRGGSADPERGLPGVSVSIVRIPAPPVGAFTCAVVLLASVSPLEECFSPSPQETGMVATSAVWLSVVNWCVILLNKKSQLALLSGVGSLDRCLGYQYQYQIFASNAICAGVVPFGFTSPTKDSYMPGSEPQRFGLLIYTFLFIDSKVYIFLYVHCTLFGVL